MSVAISATTGKPYGVERVCQVWERPRSSFYARRRREQAPARVPAKRGPKTPLSDDELLERIRADLARSPFQGEGHRKV
jgi:hypothetical protein